MRRMVWAAALLSVCVAFAGCTGKEKKGDGEGSDANQDVPGGTVNEGRFELEPPVWEVGMWWNLTAEGFPSLTYVVSGDEGEDWRVDTDNPEAAFFDAREDISFLGPVRKSDLAGSQGDDRVEYFEWPLYDNSSWTTTWDGVRREITATHEGNGVFSFEAVEEDRLAVTYTYDPAVRWLTEIAFYDEEGNPARSGRLADHGANYTGTMARYRLHVQVQASGAGPAASTFSFSAPDAATDIWLEYQIVCFDENRPWAITVRHSDPAQAAQTWTRNGPPCDGEPFAGAIRADPPPGNWEVAYSWAEDADKPVYRIAAIVRELQEFTLAEGPPA